MSLKSYGFTHKGLIRDNNEDSILVENDLKLYAVADGVGGARYGEVASCLAVETLKGHIQTNIGNEKRTVGGQNPELSRHGELLVSAVKESHYSIVSKANKEKKFAGMMTTVAVVFLDDEKIHIAHIGDSRVYLLREKELLQQTKDHTLLNYQLDNNLIKEEDASSFPAKNAITHALGMEDELFVEYRKKKFYKDDIYLIATDGLTDIVTDEEIKSILAENDGLEEKTHRLFEKAMEQGGKDNISIILIQT